MNKVTLDLPEYTPVKLISTKGPPTDMDGEICKIFYGYLLESPNTPDGEPVPILSDEDERQHYVYIRRNYREDGIHYLAKTIVPESKIYIELESGRKAIFPFTGMCLPINSAKMELWNTHVSDMSEEWWESLDKKDHAIATQISGGLRVGRD